MAKVNEKAPTAPRKTITVVMALANKMMDELRFEDRVNEQVDWDKHHWAVSPGGLAKAVALSTLTDMRTPLTHIQERLRPYDLAHLTGYEVERHDVNSFNVGRALERIGEADYNRIYEGAALAALHQYSVPVGRLHSDTTTVSFYGEYDAENIDLTEEERKELLQIEKGYNKDGRPGCKQMVVGQIVTGQGIPLANRALDGSTSDIEWNKQSLDYLESLRANGFAHGAYVADSKLVTRELIERMNGGPGRVSFVSRCPANFEDKLESRMIEKAYEEGAWEDLGQLGSGKKASSYRSQSFSGPVCGGPVRLLVLESSALMAKAELSLEKEAAKLGPIVKALEKKTFACREDAEKEYGRFEKLKELKLFSCTAKIQEETLKKWPRGRRNAATRPTVAQTYRVKAEKVGRDEEACLRHVRNESCFVIISNITDKTTTDRELLETYKGQYAVENSFRQLKGPSLASVIYLKNPKRIQALTMILSFSLLLRALIQHRLRAGLAKRQKDCPGEPVYAGWNGRELKNPTFKLLYEQAANCFYEREKLGEYSFIWPHAEAQYIVGSLLLLMGETVGSILA
ncbi:MAG: IS1634 family transposase [Clostridiales bacterium]|nr:IS1634 family transposase [Clostridiales bacterium]